MALKLIHDPLLSERTTLRLGGPALVEVILRAEDDLDQLAKALPELGGRPLALGAGSNLLAGDGRHDLVLVRAANNAAPVVDRAPGGTLVRVGAGYGLPGLLGLCQRLGLSGLEGLAGVPGKVGGAVAMNAGSYGVETGVRLTRVRLWTPEDGLFWKDAGACSMGYRRFDPKLSGRPFWLIWEAEFRLDADEPDAVRGRMLSVYAKKKASQPVTAKSAGCVFKNPEGKSAGLLLDQSGMKGQVIGGMAFSKLHANFLVNQGGGTAEQALELLDLGRRAVLGCFGVELETEVVVLS